MVNDAVSGVFFSSLFSGIAPMLSISKLARFLILLVGQERSKMIKLH